jgi:hypothetical protein
MKKIYEKSIIILTMAAAVYVLVAGILEFWGIKI